MILKFCGAARQVTGSMHLLETSFGYKILVDCGVDYEMQKSYVRYYDFTFPFDPADIDCVILTHAHIDHSGNLPFLIKNGYTGKILCTPATAKLTELLLRDSFNIMEEEHLKNKRRSRHHRRVKPLPYTRKQVKQVIENMVTLHFDKTFRIDERITVTFQCAGHILGAASASLVIEEEEGEVKVGFTGDLGNYNSKLVRDPEPFVNHHVIIGESTYGGRQHTGESPYDIIMKHVTETCVENYGKLVIPAFSVGRSHSIAFTIAQLMREGKFPAHVPVYIDSPLSYACAELYHEFLAELNDEARKFYSQNGDLFIGENISFTDSREQSDYLAMNNESCVIISAAGMVEGGRIQKHIRETISNPKSTILIAGFCAEGTLGHRLLQGQSKISMNYTEYRVYAKIYRTDAFSAHPDHSGLTRYYTSCKNDDLNHLFLVHGEYASISSLANELEDVLNCSIHVPDKNDQFEIFL